MLTPKSRPIATNSGGTLAMLDCDAIVAIGSGKSRRMSRCGEGCKGQSLAHESPSLCRPTTGYPVIRPICRSQFSVRIWGNLLPLRDNLGIRQFPYMTALLVAINVLVFFTWQTWGGG